MTDPGIIIPAAAGLVGAIIGGVLSIIGSVLVSRYEHKRQQRGRIYDGYLPALLSGPSASADVEGMLRAATVAGREDRRRAVRIRPLYEETQQTQEALRKEWGSVPSDREIAEADAARQRLRVELESYADWLEKKLR